MKATSIAMGLAGLGALAVLAGCGTQKAMAADKDRLGNVRGAVDLTVYKNDFAQVQETRPVALENGRTKLRIGDVSKQLDPSSLLFDWPGSKTDASVVANVFDLGVAGGEGLLSRYVGKEVEMVWYGQDGREGSREKGVLEVAANGQLVLHAGDRLLVNPTGMVVAQARSEVVTMPQLSVDVDSSAKQTANLSVAYMPRGMSWSADYVAKLDPESDILKLECWATVTNRTGADYPNAKITLVAGSPNRATRTPMGMDGAMAKMDMSGGVNFGGRRAVYVDSAVAAPIATGELYSYPVKARATIAQEQMNRVSMLESPKVSIKKDYSIRLPGAAGYDYYEWGQNGRTHRRNAQLAITFTNEEKSGLGDPLPSGAVRVYEPDAEGTMRYIGAASIQDTPKDTKVDLTLTDVFDVTAEPKIVKTERIDKRSYRTEYEVVLRNQKKGSVSLRLVESIGGKWRVESESHKSVKLNAYENQWTVEVPSGKEVKLRYTVRFGQ